METESTELRLVIAKNLTELRRNSKWTQLELAEQLNYTDKAISKWERGESVPDIVILKRIADLFGVTVDYLITEEHNAPSGTPCAAEAVPVIRKHRVIAMLSILLVWFVATVIFVVLSLVPAIPNGAWLAFIYAIPVSAIVWLIFNTLWFNPRRNYVLVSLLMWGFCCAVHLTVLLAGFNFWMIYILGIPGQVSIIIWSVMGKKAKAAVRGE